MGILDGRRRTGYLFLAVLLGHILLISAQVQSKTGVPLLQAVAFGVFAEVQRGTSAVLSGFRRAWMGYIDLRHVQAENELLKRRLAEAEIQIQEEKAQANRSRQLEQLMGLRDRLDLQTVAAEIIGAGASPDFRTVTIDKGTIQGIRRDMAVISPAGAVGRVIVPSARAAKVQLLVDHNAAAGVLIERSRAQGVVVGDGENRLRMEYVSEVEDIVSGDVVVTSGIDGIFPKGFVIGRIDTVEKSGGAYSHIAVKPAVDFSSLEEVLVVLTPTTARDLTAERDQ